MKESALTAGEMEKSGKVIETLEKLKELADTAWKEFPESIPVQNAFGELVEEVMVKPFAEGRDVQE